MFDGVCCWLLFCWVVRFGGIWLGYRWLWIVCLSSVCDLLFFGLMVSVWFVFCFI